MSINIPLGIVNEYTNKYPGIWSRIDQIAQKNVDNTLWDSALTYVPGPVLLNEDEELMLQVAKDLDTIPDARIVAALASWRRHKQVYRFDPDLFRLLAEQADENTIIPKETLLHLPYQCIYIDLTPQHCEADGVFVSWDLEVTGNMEITKSPLLLFTMVRGTSCYPNYVSFDYGETIQDIVDNMKANMRETIAKATKAMQRAMEAYFTMLGDTLPVFIQLTLYLCAANREVAPEKEQEAVYRPPAPYAIKDKRREVRLFECGRQTGELIRKFQISGQIKRAKETAAGKGSPKRPHSRRAHWHHYWTGPRDGKRQLILKWNPPAFINADLFGQKDLPTTTNIVNQETKGEE